MGINEDYFDLMNAEAVEGALFTKTEAQSRTKIAVLGYTIAENLFEVPDNAIGKTIRFENQRFKVIGVIKKTGDNEQDKSIVIPYKSTFGSINPDKTFWSIYLGVESEDNVEIAKLKADGPWSCAAPIYDFSVTEQSEILSTIDQIFAVINGFLIAIGSISLIVGGIGIMNIMFASVTERTKEIGIRRAVGATEKDILYQFLTESVMLSAFGGIVGLLLSIVIVLIIRRFFPASINALAVILALGISSAIGIFFGVFPARRASKLPPIEAIRYE